MTILADDVPVSLLSCPYLAVFLLKSALACSDPEEVVWFVCVFDPELLTAVSDRDCTAMPHNSHNINYSISDNHTQELVLCLSCFLPLSLSHSLSVSFYFTQHARAILLFEWTCYSLRHLQSHGQTSHSRVPFFVSSKHMWHEMEEKPEKGKETMAHSQGDRQGQALLAMQERHTCV